MEPLGTRLAHMIELNYVDKIRNDKIMLNLVLCLVNRRIKYWEIINNIFKNRLCKEDEIKSGERGRMREKVERECVRREKV